MKLALNSLAFAAGCALPWMLPWLLPVWLLPLLGVVAIAVRRFEKGAMILFLVGFGYGLFVTNQSNSHQIGEFPQGLDAIVEGHVVDLPDHQQQRTRFLFVVERFEPLGDEQVEHPPRLLRLTWYYPESLGTGDSFRFEVRLRRPRGLANSSQFDYRQWLLAEGIDATGYVRQLLDLQKRDFSGFNRWRERQRTLLQNQGLHHADLIAALSIGDRSGINADQWQLFATTGIIHLMVISGLHLGFASLLGYWMGSWCMRPLAMLRPGWKAQDFGWLCALLVALLYAFCAGFSTPTLRAFIMISTLAVARLLGLRVSIWIILALAFALVLLFQPLSILSAGLWMSFGAVAVLVAAFQGRAKEARFLGLIRAQLVLFVGFSVLPMVFGNPVPLVAPLVNLFAVPLVGLLVVPLVLLGMIGELIGLSLGSLSWRLADFCLVILHDVLIWLQGRDLPQIYPPDLSLWAFVLLGSAAFAIVALPARARLWPLLLLGLLPIYLPRYDDNFLTLHIFDVGQGTAVLVEQPGYMLLYDTGPAFSQNFNAGRDILLPFLQRDRTSVHDLVVSHGDADHAGGAAAVLESGWVNGRLLVGEPLGLDTREVACRTPQHWRVGEVNYHLLHPPPDFSARDNNDRSCVLLIRFKDKQILLSGDISSAVERRLLAQFREPLDVLLVPHHGSATSSSAAMLDALRPEVAIVSSGYGNAFGHPAEAVVDRYNSLGSMVLNTATAGAIQIQWNSAVDQAEISLARDANWLWWQE